MNYTNHIEEFLKHFSDQSLANLQCATEDGELNPHNPCKCLVHHYIGNYFRVRVADHPLGQLAFDAEVQFLKSDDRLETLLPLIQAEWTRRDAEKQSQIKEKIKC